MSWRGRSTPEEVATRLGFPPSSVESFLKGEVVTQELDASNDKDLSLLVVTVADTTVDKLFELAEQERVHEIQAATISAGVLDPSDVAAGLDGMDLLDEDTVKSLLKNPFMSKAEAKELRDGHKNGRGVEAYKRILADRATAYWENGLDGIVPYDGKGRDPSTDLKSANDAALKAVTDPVVHEEVFVIPSRSQNPEWHKLKWALQKGNDQMAPVLSHTIRIKRELGYVGVTRNFYSGTDYDCSQIVTGVIPTADGRSAIFYVNRTFSSAVAGFGGSAKRSIGRKMMKSKLIETMKKGQAVAKDL
mmetsp:Transcript_15974/g.32120  ORF Transcript_15974/g.32120 Transcript_15974/m.32120 type:complete len:304 (-) Transcript_15974:96-1007(-)|eukprot:CAMPEP_0178486578 /NCGR_PEP_ID=MMETSP0696-20121128/8878_1 /TAXON_ID=265572 /ORGANISM="Extubocellulus spinifer, Strain CCMP396" /LENGTH=303 /DNA_ID=CAMNT_0020114243 /DNA_START=32 /DNA_END=946 /DNA_ORIENTATION=+